jgi:hypothetical protein
MLVTLQSQPWSWCGELLGGLWFHMGQFVLLVNPKNPKQKVASSKITPSEWWTNFMVHLFLIFASRWMLQLFICLIFHLCIRMKLMISYSERYGRHLHIVDLKICESYSLTCFNHSECDFVMFDTSFHGWATLNTNFFLLTLNYDFFWWNLKWTL